MTRQKWTSDEQHDWLEERKAAFVEANQKRRAAKDFFPGVVKDFCTKWPVPEATEEEIKDAKSIEFAMRVKRNMYEKRILNWFPNNARAVGSTSTSREILKVTPVPMPKKRQAWQVYHSMTYESKWKPHIDKGWTEYKTKWEAEHPGENITKGQRFIFMTEFIKARYAEEPDDVKQLVEENRKSCVAAPEISEAQRKNHDYQNAINMLPRTLSSIGQSLKAQTGWNITIIAGGPSPGHEGAIMTFLSHTGNTKNNENFEQYLGQKEYDEHILLPFDKFLRASFSPEDCASRRITKQEADKKESGEDGESGDLSEGNSLGKDNEEESVHPKQPAQSEYEIRKQNNIAKLKKLVEGIREQVKVPEVITKKTEKKTAPKDEKSKDEEPTVRRQSMRNQPILDRSATETTSVDGTSGIAPPPTSTVSEAPTIEQSNTQVPLTPVRASAALAIIQKAITKSPIRKEESVQINAQAAQPSGKPLRRTPKKHFSERNFSHMPGPYKRRISAPPSPVGTQVPSPSPLSAPTVTAAQDKQDVDIPPQRDPSESPEDFNGEGLPPWLVNMLGYLRKASEDVAWQRLVRRLVEFERSKPQNGNLPTKHRPQEISDWIRSKKKDAVPSINPALFGPRFMEWWLAMQPIWRQKGNLARSPPDGETWSVLKKGGSSGLYVVVVALSWWIKGQHGARDANAWSAVEDLTWIFQQLSSLVPQAAISTPQVLQKRQRDDDEVEKSGEKRRKSSRRT